jgi:hypothetical protein
MWPPCHGRRRRRRRIGITNEERVDGDTFKLVPPPQPALLGRRSRQAGRLRGHLGHPN